MAKSAKIKVQLDTKQALAQLRDLTKKGAATAGRIGGKIRGVVGRGLGAVGLGGAIGAGLGAVQGATASGVGDIAGEVFGGIGANINDRFLGDHDDNARANKGAREEVVKAFGAIAGHRGSVPPEAEKYFQQVKALRLEQEKGRSLIEGDSRFRTTDGGDVVDRIMGESKKLLWEAVEVLGTKLSGGK